MRVDQIETDHSSTVDDFSSINEFDTGGEDFSLPQQVYEELDQFFNSNPTIDFTQYN